MIGTDSVAIIPPRLQLADATCAPFTRAVLPLPRPQRLAVHVAPEEGEVRPGLGSLGCPEPSRGRQLGRPTDTVVSDSRLGRPLP